MLSLYLSWNLTGLDSVASYGRLLLLERKLRIFSNDGDLTQALDEISAGYGYGIFRQSSGSDPLFEELRNKEKYI